MTRARVILAIDAGTSSVRCTGYEYHGAVDFDARLRPPSSPSSRPQHPASEPIIVTAMEDIRHSVPMSSVVPNAGHVRTDELISAVEECIDAVLGLLRTPRQKKGETSSSPSRSDQCQYYRVVAVGFSTFVMNLVAVDKNGDPVGERATASYACNREDVVRECRNLKGMLGPEKVREMYQRTGAPLHPAYALPQLLAFYRDEHNKTMARRIDKWTTISSVCIHRWSGKQNRRRRRRSAMPVSYSEASWTGMLNFRTCEWDDEAKRILDECDGVFRCSRGEEGDNGGIDLLPPLVDHDQQDDDENDNDNDDDDDDDDPTSSTTRGIPRLNGDGTDNPYWGRWPELRSAFLFPGVGDGVAANVGSKCGGGVGGSDSEHGDGDDVVRVAVTVGTSAACRVVLPLSVRGPRSSSPSPSSPSRDYDASFSVPPGLFCYRVDRRRILVGGALTDGGSVVEWARSLLGLQSDESFRACMEKVSEMYERNCSGSSPPNTTADGGGVVTMVPFLSGERSTGFRGGARGCISGLTRETGPEHVMYACLESVVARLGRVLELLLNETTLPSSSGRSRGGRRDDERPSTTTRGRVLVASGAALLRSPLWRQMLADCTSADVVVDGGESSSSSGEGTSRGVALLAAGALRRRELLGNNDDRGRPTPVIDSEEPLTISHRTRANPAARERWRTVVCAQESLIDAVSSTWNDA